MRGFNARLTVSSVNVGHSGTQVKVSPAGSLGRDRKTLMFADRTGGDSSITVFSSAKAGKWLNLSGYLCH
jgi:hypothetical protein